MKNWKVNYLQLLSQLLDREISLMGVSLCINDLKIESYPYRGTSLTRSRLLTRKLWA